jgi:hypothetical protein
VKQEPLKLPSEEFLLPVHKYNDAVGPLFAEFKGRFPMLDHSENSLQHSLGIFLTAVYTRAMEQMKELQPVPLTREEWMAAPTELKAQHIHWQRNLKYLKQRNDYFVNLITPRRHVL